MADNPLWDYSLKLYGRTGVSRHCLDLQDRFGANVNVLLFGCWLGSQGMVLDDDALRDAQAAIAAWNQHVTLPRRARRRGLDLSSAGAAQEKQRLLTEELEAEREEQARLLHWYNRHYASLVVISPIQAIAHNLNGYLAVLGAEGAAIQPLLDAALAEC